MKIGLVGSTFILNLFRVRRAFLNLTIFMSCLIAAGDFSLGNPNIVSYNPRAFRLSNNLSQALGVHALENYVLVTGWDFHETPLPYVWEKVGKNPFAAVAVDHAGYFWGQVNGAYFIDGRWFYVGSVGGYPTYWVNGVPQLMSEEGELLAVSGRQGRLYFAGYRVIDGLRKAIVGTYRLSDDTITWQDLATPSKASSQANGVYAKQAVGQVLGTISQDGEDRAIVWENENFATVRDLSFASTVMPGYGYKIWNDCGAMYAVYQGTWRALHPYFRTGIGQWDIDLIDLIRIGGMVGVFGAIADDGLAGFIEIGCGFRYEADTVRSTSWDLSVPGAPVYFDLHSTLGPAYPSSFARDVFVRFSDPAPVSEFRELYIAGDAYDCQGNSFAFAWIGRRPRFGSGPAEFEVDQQSVNINALDPAQVCRLSTAP